ncbi:MAG: transposase [Bacteroidetes bacterium]|nr:transposase [Bacteroidota bacterium]
MCTLLPRIDALKCYLSDARLQIDNNLTENAIRPVAVGRKITCSPDHIRLHNMQPSSIHCLPLAKPKISILQTWLTETLIKIGSHPINRIHELLPGAKLSNDNC